MGLRSLPAHCAALSSSGCAVAMTEHGIIGGHTLVFSLCMDGDLGGSTGGSERYLLENNPLFPPNYRRIVL